MRPSLIALGIALITVSIAAPVGADHETGPTLNPQDGMGLDAKEWTRMATSCSGTGDGACLFDCEGGTAVVVQASGVEAVVGECGPLVAACVSTTTCTATSVARTPANLVGVCKGTGVGTFSCEGG